MKFLCVECDEAMSLKETRGPDEGSLTVIFSCPECNREVGMLTNPMETQMVRSLGVKVGGRTVPAEPMETVKTSLSDGRDDVFAEEAAPEAAQPEAAAEESESKCPFSGAVADAFAQQESELTWTPEAEARLERIPSFIRPMVRKSIEQHAKEKGLAEINETVMAEMRDVVGMKYS